MVTPTRRVRPNASVVPASPTNNSSLSRSSAHTDAVVRNHSPRDDRTPNSAARERTSGLTCVAESPLSGSNRIVVPRASLL